MSPHAERGAAAAEQGPGAGCAGLDGGHPDRGCRRLGEAVLDHPGDPGHGPFQREPAGGIRPERLADAQEGAPVTDVTGPLLGGIIDGVGLERRDDVVGLPAEQAEAAVRPGDFRVGVAQAQVGRVLGAGGGHEISLNPAGHVAAGRPRQVEPGAQTAGSRGEIEGGVLQRVGFRIAQLIPVQVPGEIQLDVAVDLEGWRGRGRRALDREGYGGRCGRGRGGRRSRSLPTGY